MMRISIRTAVLGVLCGLVVAGCEKPEAYVECRANGATLSAGMMCSVEHRAGRHGLRACWTLSVACVNGAAGTADGCGEAQPKAKASTLLPYSAFRGALDKCDQVSSASVGAMKLVEL